jgi:hypothetical protein
MSNKANHMSKDWVESRMVVSGDIRMYIAQLQHLAVDSPSKYRSTSYNEL